MTSKVLLFFESEASSAKTLASMLNCQSKVIKRHDFPDGEFKLQLPSDLLPHVILFHTLDHPNEKLIELLFVARTVRQMGIKRLTLVAPYLAYMRQDIAFFPGEVVSQRIVGDLLASLFDDVITVDPHLHRITQLREAIPAHQAIAISAAPVLADFVVTQRMNPFLVGPDSESLQWILQAASSHRLDHAVAQKIRHSDTEVEITLPLINVKNRAVILLDDIASSGHTLGCAAELLLAAGAKTVDVAVTHALFNGDALGTIKRSGVDRIWSTDTVAHITNSISVMPAISEVLNSAELVFHD